MVVACNSRADSDLQEPRSSSAFRLAGMRVHVLHALDVSLWQ